MWEARPGRKAGDCADEVTLSCKGAKSRTSSRNLRSTGAKARTHVDRLRASNNDLEEQLKASRRELAVRLEAARFRYVSRRTRRRGRSRRAQQPAMPVIRFLRRS